MSNNRLHAGTNTRFTRLYKTTAALALGTMFFLSSLMLSVTLPSDLAGHILLFDAVYAGDYDDGNSG